MRGGGGVNEDLQAFYLNGMSCNMEVNGHFWDAKIETLLS